MRLISNSSLKPVSDNRSKLLDALKGCLIFLVCLGHGIQYNTYEDHSLFWNDVVFKSIYSFHMPLFMALSGYLTISLFKDFSLNKLKRKMLSLVVPIISWSTLYSIYLVINEGGSVSLYKLISVYLFGLWYLWALIMSCVTLFLFINKKYLLLAFMMVAVFAGKKYYTIYMFIYTFPYYIVGYCLASTKSNLLRNAENSYVLILLAAIFICSVFYWNKETYIYVTHMDFTSANLENIVMRWIIGAINSAFFVLLIKKLKVESCDWIVFIGTRSLTIYIISIFVQQNILPLFPTNDPVLAIIQAAMYAMCTVILGLIISFLMGKNRYISFLLAGSRLPSKKNIISDAPEQ